MIQGQNDSLLKAGIAAENQKDQRFSQLGGATQMKAGEDRQAFNINKMQPFERKYNLLAMKAGAANKTANDGLQNMFNGLGSIGNAKMLENMYGNQTGGANANVFATASNNPRSSLNQSLYRYGVTPQDERFPY